MHQLLALNGQTTYFFFREKSKWASLLRPFEMSVWILEIISIIAMTPIMFYFSR